MESSRETLLEGFELDITELQQLLTQAKREHTKQVLQHEISILVKRKELELQNQPKKLDEIKVAEATKASDVIQKDNVIYTQISSYGWEIYVTSGVDGVGKHDKKNIDCEFNDQSLDLRILDLNKKNLRLKIDPLNGIIDPASCKMKIKSNSITLELKKGKDKYWTDVKQTKESLDNTGKKKGGDDEMGGDPQASLMKLMKDMYDQGDDNMKRTIAESWEKARHEQQQKKL